ncbi:hypothetical protein MUN76_15370 [Leucobacter rhizosphaerae]|uniref:Major facilitator superfamily (MFS) profile domain-containing protein n=1 Tax=Leucobacter rhizosphaerae TaxID=2932245 RepID=A0ABY4FVS6_9MICO|nr:hypothetical protein [Leucobacter rhizosphaerae]UOQ60388.1 hypothetical protein MUN76_15370 [Leucobacter rhizosphaerae]
MAKTDSVAPVWARVLSLGVVLIAVGVLNVTIAGLIEAVTLFGVLMTLGVIALAAGAVMFLYSRRA